MSLVLRIARIIAGGIILGISRGILTTHPDVVLFFSSLGIDSGAMIGIGVIQLIAGLFLLFGKKESRFGGLIGALILSGVLHTHLTNMGITQFSGVIVIALIACFVVLWIQRNEMITLLRHPSWKKQLIITGLIMMMYSINYLAASGSLGLSPTQLGDLFPFPYMLPGWMFGFARGSIYLMLGLFVAIGRTNKMTNQRLYHQLMPRLVITCLLNMLRLWISSTGDIQLAVIIIFLLWRALGKMVSMIAKTPLSLRGERRSISIPRGMYYGWVSLAAGILAISQLVYLYARLLPVTRERTRLMVIVGIGITAISFWKRRNRGQLLISARAVIGILSAIITYYAT